MADNEQIGLQGVLDLTQFTNNVGLYSASIARMAAETEAAADRVSKGMGSAGTATSGLGGALSGIMSWLGGGVSQFVSLGQGVLEFGAIAGGAALAGVAALTAGLVLLGSTALTEYSKYERMALSVESLVARELTQGQLVEQQRTVKAQLTAKEAAELQNLQTKIQSATLARVTDLAAIQEQKQRIIQLTAAYGENGLNVQTAKGKLAEMEFGITKADQSVAQMTARVDELNGKNGSLVTTIEKVRVGTMSMQDAMSAAGPKARDLLQWIQQLAIQSPFDEEGVAIAFRTAMAYGFTSDRARELVTTTADYAAATGQTSDTLNRVLYSLGQMNSLGKTSARELRELSNAGIPVNKILQDMGFTLDDVSNGNVDVQKFMAAVVAEMNVFQGAAKIQSTTWGGLLNSMSDLKKIGLREFFAGTFQAIQPYVVDFVSTISNPTTLATLNSWGVVLGTQVAGGITTVLGLAKTLAGAFQAGGVGGLVAALGLTPQTTELINKVVGSITLLGTTIGGILNPALTSLSGGGALALLNTGIAWLNQNFTTLQAVVLGVGAVLGASAIAAIIAGIGTVIAALVSPVGLVLIAAAALSAAWVNNWGNIQAITYTAWAVLQSIFAGIVSALQPLGASFGQLTAAMASMGISWADVGNAMLTAIGYVAAGIGVALLVIVSGIIGLVTGIVNAGTQIINGVQTWLGYFQMFATGVIQIFQGDLLTGIANVMNGIVGMTNTAWNTLIGSVVGLVQGFVTTIISFWTGLYDSLVGHSIVWDIVNGIVAAFNTLIAPVLQIFSQLSTSISNALSSVLGPLMGGGQGQAASPLDMTAVISSITSAVTAAQNLISVLQTVQMLFGTSLPAALLLFGTLTSAALLQVLLTLTNTQTLLTLIAITTLPTLGTTTTVVAAAMVTAFRSVQDQLVLVQMALVGIRIAIDNMATGAQVAAIATVAAFKMVSDQLAELAGKAKEYGNDIKEALNSATNAMKNLVSQIEKAVDAFDKMKTAAEAAAAAARSAGSASGAATPGNTGGFASGTGPQGFTVPGGYPNDTYQQRLTSGEQMLVAPPGQSLDALIARRLQLQAPAAPRGGLTLNVGPVTLQSPLDVEMFVSVLKARLAGTV